MLLLGATGSIGRSIVDVLRAHPAAYNAPTEVAVDTFLAAKLSVPGIVDVSSRTLEADWPDLVGSSDDVLSIDSAARNVARDITQDLQKDTE